MTKKLTDSKELRIERPPRIMLSATESLKRTKTFDERRERFIAGVRKSES
jgi:hypothetical protein